MSSPFVVQCAFCGVDCDGKIFANRIYILHYGRLTGDYNESETRNEWSETLHFCSEAHREHYYFGL